MSVRASVYTGFTFQGIARVAGCLLLAACLVACGGGGGSNGKKGNTGAPGTPAGVDINNADSINAEITDVTVASPPVVEFRLRDDNGNAVRNLPASSIRFTIAKLMPGTDGNASAWQSYINDLDDGAVQADRESGADGTLVDHGDGTYTYTFATDITKVTNPIAVPYDASLTHRVSFEIRGFVPVHNPAYDFRPNDGATTGLFSREIVKTATCNRCHEELALHGGARFETRQCVSCHNPGSTDGQTGNTVDFKVMIHKIHRGEDLPSVIGGQDYCIQGFSLQCFGEVVFPQDVRNCSTCHDAGDPDTPQAANWYEKPTMEACGSCHDDVNFATGEGHAEDETGIGIVADNSQCVGCHASSPLSRIEVRQAHRIREQEAAEQFRFNIEDVTFGGLGTAPVVQFSITDPTNNDKPYDLAVDPEMTGSNSSLRFTLAWNTTDYFNEGSGSNPAQTARTTLINGGVLSTDATDNMDGTYSMPLSVIPNGTAVPITGSGAVTLEGHPVVEIGTTEEEVPATSAVAYFGIEDPADITQRRMKVDINRCDNCHKLLSLHGGNRNNNPQVCVTCHNPNATDINRRPADPADAVDGKVEEAIDFKRMIHRIHAANIVVYGFNNSVNDFRDVHFPQRLSHCTACHTDNGFYPVAFDSGVLATTISTGADPASPLDDVNITPNASACSACHMESDAQLHMEQNGGSFDACQGADGQISVRVDTCGGTPGPTIAESCTVCHGPGRTADVAVVHEVD